LYPSDSDDCDRNGVGVEDDDDLANVSRPESTGVPYRSMGVFDRALRGRNVAWPELDGCWNWNCCWSGEAAVLPDLGHCNITDSIEDDRISLWRLSDCRDGEVDLARLVWGLIGWRS
jgi:hypothetical protein